MRDKCEWLGGPEWIKEDAFDILDLDTSLNDSFLREFRWWKLLCAYRDGGGQGKVIRNINLFKR